MKPKYRPSIDLKNLSKYDNELPQCHSVNTLFVACESNGIYWTSENQILKLIHKLNTDQYPIIIINLIAENKICYKNLCSKNIKIFDVPIRDDFDAAKTILNKFNDIVNVIKTWKSCKRAKLIIHCKHGLHRSFSIACLISMFVNYENLQNNCPNQSDYHKQIDMLQEKNKFIFNPTGFSDESIKKMYQMFKF